MACVGWKKRRMALGWKMASWGMPALGAWIVEVGCSLAPWPVDDVVVDWEECSKCCLKDSRDVFVVIWDRVNYVNLLTNTSN